MQKWFLTLRKVILLTGDIGILLLATHLASLLVFYGRPSQLMFTGYYYMVAVMIVAAGILFNVNGLFSLARKSYSELLISLAVTVFNLFIFMISASFLLHEFSYSRSVFVVTSVLQFIMLAIWNYIFWRIEYATLMPNNVLVIGNQSECIGVITRLYAKPQLNYKVQYICSNCKNDDWKTAAQNMDLIIICANLSLADKADIVHFCYVNGIQVFLIPDVYELFCRGVELDKIDDIPVFYPRNLKLTLEQLFLKRLLDLIVTGTALLFLWPIFILIAIAVKMDSPGPVLYSQVRTGRDAKEFKIYKFRSMRHEAEKMTGPVLTAENDPRVTRVGRLLRATRLDELPQLFNVLLGDMSIVGPRPERPFFVNQFKGKIPEYLYRNNVKPGITGLAQIYGKYNTTPYNKLVYDLIYIQRCNVLTDLVIMLQTMRVLVTKSSTEGLKNTKCTSELSRYQINDAG